MAVKRVPTTTKVIGMLDERGLLEPVLDKDLSTPPASPSTGDRYIVKASGTGAWSGHDNEVADWNGSSWDFTPSLTEGLVAYVKDEDDIYIYTGSSWVKPYGDGTGDMLKSVYDTGDNGIVDKAETIDDGTYSATAQDVEDAVDKKHDRLHDIDSASDHNGVGGATENDLIAFDANGLPKDSGLLTADVIQKDGSVGFTAAVSGQTPTTATHLTTKGYVDSVAQGLDWQDSVLDQDLSTPPASPSSGDRYIVKASGTGDWNGHDNEIAEWNGSSWDFTSLSEGLAVWIEDEDKLYVYNGSAWVKFGSTIDHTQLQNKGTNTHAEIDSHIDDATLHRIINDSGTSATELWSASKINTELGGKSDTGHDHDASYYTETELDAGQLDNRYYTETEIDTFLGNYLHKTNDSLDDVLDGSTYGRVKNTELTTGFVDRLNDGSSTATAAEAEKAYDTRAQYDSSTDEIVFVDPDTYAG